MHILSQFFYNSISLIKSSIYLTILTLKFSLNRFLYFFFILSISSLFSSEIKTNFTPAFFAPCNLNSNPPIFVIHF